VGGAQRAVARRNGQRPARGRREPLSRKEGFSLPQNGTEDRLEPGSTDPGGSCLQGDSRLRRRRTRKAPSQ